MKLTQLLTPARTLAQQTADSKKAVLELLSKTIASDLTDVDYQDIFDCLLAREKLGSTAIGHGVAIPHCRSKHVSEPIAALIQLTNSIDFAADDNQPVNLFFSLLVPEEATQEHLDILAMIAEHLHDANFRQALCQATDSQQLFQLVVNH